MANSRTTIAAIPNAERPQLQIRNPLSFGQAAKAANVRIDADKINSVAIQTMAEEGIEIAAEKPKILTTQAVKASDVVITMGCGDAWPLLPR